MEASSGRFRVRPIVVDFLATLFATLCIGVATAMVLGVCVVLMAGEARGAAREPAPANAANEKARAEAAQAKAMELVLTHQLVTKYTSLVAIDRTSAR